MDDAPPSSMAFFEPSLLARAWRGASAFAGPGGRVASMPDVVAARLAVPVDRTWHSRAWRHYWTTTSCEMVGPSPGGTRVLAVMHGGMPGLDSSNVAEAYEQEAQDGRRGRGCMLLPVSTFHQILDGMHGPVETMDLDAYLRDAEYAFHERLSPEKALSSRLLRMRLGERYAQYVGQHAAVSLAHAAEQGLPAQAGSIVSLGGSDTHRRPLPDDGMACAWLLSIGGLSICLGGPREESVTCDLGVHGRGDGVRMLGMRGGPDSDVHPGLDYDAALRDPARRERLMVDTSGPEEGPWRLMDKGGLTWTHASKQGDGMDTGVPRHAVLGVEGMGEGGMTVRVGGYHGFLKYGIDEVRAVMPPGANAYRIGSIDVSGDARSQHVGLRFYRADVDTGRRLLTEEDVADDVGLLLSLAGAGTEAGAARPA